MRDATRRIGAVYDEALAPFGINVAQYPLLRRIGTLQPVSFTRLGHERELDRSTASRNTRVPKKGTSGGDGPGRGGSA
ncbi:winged helix-turn-helix transcriptional regulator [Pseudogemmobacter bohemicus]|uniref:winged helix-turn-helix transcriptional regulator n=1 Tax=Pseudogemmobacter bohemicus TaxID=2250708 RepID=UPI0018E55BD5|nr:winged helix-turn-helix transcriptional regulator [Pseudogemmobacter bohemicus]